MNSTDDNKPAEEAIEAQPVQPAEPAPAGMDAPVPPTPPTPIPYHPPMIDEQRRRDRRTILALGIACGILILLLAAAVLAPIASTLVNGSSSSGDSSISALSLDSPVDDSTVESESITFTWESEVGASGYYFTIYSQTDASDSLTTTVTRNQCTVEGLADGSTYCWKVAPIYYNKLGDWSDIWTFVVDIATAAPDLSSNTNNTAFYGTPELSWGSVASATSYRLQISNDSSFSDILLDEELTNTSYAADPGLEENTTYYWRVAAYGDDEWSAWSSYYCFYMCAEYIHFTHTWTFYMDGTNWTVDLNISAVDYAADRAQARISGYSLEEYSEYVTPSDAAVVALATELKEMAESKGYDTYTTACFVLSFVQTMTYETDENSTGIEEYPRYPVEMLVDNCGDCEDSSALFCSLITSSVFNMDAVEVYLESQTSSVAHMAVGLVIDRSDLPAEVNFTYGGKTYTTTQDEMAGWTVFSSFHQSKLYYYCECTSEYPIGWPTSVTNWRYSIV